MKLLVDQNISHRILSALRPSFPEIMHVKDAGLIDANDHDIFMYARKNGFDAVVTIDDDFVKLLHQFSAPPKIVWVRTGNCSINYLAQLLLAKQETIQRFLEDDDYILYEVFNITP